MKRMTCREAVKEALMEEMRRDPSVFMLGEDIADPEGGAVKVTVGISTEFGTERVRNTPISETAIVGCAIGAATQGLRPVAELMYFDFVGVCMDMITNQAAKIHYMSGGEVKVPMVIRTQGGPGRGAGPQHSNCLEAWFMHTPGLIVAAPSCAADAKGLLKTAIRNDNPVLFLEHCVLYNVKGDVPDGDYTIPFGKADIKRTGSDVTIVSYWRMVDECLKAAEELAKEGINAEVIDLRTLLPMDTETIIKSVEKTHRAVIVSEDVGIGSVTKEIGACIGNEAFYSLDAPIEYVNTAFCPIPFAPVLENSILPQASDIIAAVRKTME